MTTTELRREARKIGCELVTKECLEDLMRGNSEGARLWRVVNDAHMALYYLLEDFRLGFRARRRVKRLRQDLIEAARPRR